MCICCGLSGLLAGCAPVSRLHLIQPHLPGYQQHLNLTSETALWSPGEGVERVLAEFPPPGATTGRPLVLVYLRFPAGVAEPGVGAKSGPAAKGFFIQTQGEYAGLSAVVGGKLVVAGRSKSANATRRLKLDLKCEDGSSLVGEIQARRDDWAIQQFETKRQPADVRALEPQARSAPATKPGG